MFKKSFFILLVVVFIAGCSSSATKQAGADDSLSIEEHSESNSDEHSGSGSGESNTSLSNEVEEHNSKSITDYHSTITGENMSTSKLTINKNDKKIILKMRLELSKSLMARMRNTIEPFYFSFMEVEPRYLTPYIESVNPSFVKGDIKKLLANSNNPNILIIEQEVVIKDSLTEEEEKRFLKPKNYKFTFINENHRMVAEVLGMDVDSIGY